MKIDITSMFFNSKIEGKTATPAWRTSLGQSASKECRIDTDSPGVLDILTGMTYKAVSDLSKLKMPNTSGDLLECAVFDKLFVNGKSLPNCSFVLVILRESSASHDGRMQLCYSPNLQYGAVNNALTIDKIRDLIGCSENGCWFVYDISILNQDELHFNTYVVDAKKPAIYKGTSQERSTIWKDFITKSSYSIQELGLILKHMYNHPTEEGQVAMIYAFVLEYGEHVVDVVKAKDLVSAASLTDSMVSEVTKAYNIYRYVKKHGLSNIVIKNIIKKASSTDVISSSNPTEFVWSCIKLFNNRKELETLFASKYKSQGGSQGNYVKINNCYVAQEGQLLVDDVDNIQIFDGSYLNDNFDAREVDLFRDAINDVFAGKYEISISGDEVEVYSLRELQSSLEVADNYRSYIAALRTKPFMLLAGISGTGKSRIVREMAKACWSEGEEEFGKNRPKNFCMVQVKPNWHDSSELIGYISRINGEKFVVGPFLKFMARAIQDPSKPYFLCLDEMNLAPVEQYFAEYLSVIESRKVDDAGNIVTDPLIDYEDTEAYKTLIDQLFDDDDDRKAYLTKEHGRRLTIPQNLFVIGTVNMDETTYSFSRKVLDRAMTIEMNEVNLDGGLDKDGAHEFTFIPTSAIVGTTVEGCDVYSSNSTLCDFVIKYLTKINAKLDGTPFKIAYRTRNEFLVYAVNRLLIAGDELSAEDKNRLVLCALDEMTSMKILSRIEGDETRTRTVLRELHTLLEDELKAKGIDSMSLLKIDEMLKKLDDTQYTSYWA